MNNAVLVQHVYKTAAPPYGGAYSFEPMLEAARPRHASYAKRHDMDYLIVKGQVRPEWEIVKGGWAKLEIIRQMLARGYEYVFYVDADALIVDMGADLRDGAPPEGIGLIQHQGPGVPGPHLNVGIMFIRNGERVRKFIDWWITQYPGSTQPFWAEQGVLNDARNKPEWADLIHRIDDKYNSCAAGANISPAPVIEAWHGMGDAMARTALLKACLAKLEGAPDG